MKVPLDLVEYPVPVPVPPEGFDDDGNAEKRKFSFSTSAIAALPNMKIGKPKMSFIFMSDCD